MFRRAVHLVLLIFCTMVTVKPALADLAAMGRLTKAMVLEAAEYYRSNPFDEARSAFNDQSSDRWLRQPFHLHMFGMSADGIVWADNIFYEFVGQDFKHVYDIDGFPIGRTILSETAKTSEPFQLQVNFISPETGDKTISIGNCLRPDPDNVICSWSQRE